MKCDCIKTEGQSFRETFQDNPRKKAHLAVKVVSSLGLKQFILKKFVFRSKQSKYKIEGGELLDLSGQPVSYNFPQHKMHAEVLSSVEGDVQISVPIVFLKRQSQPASLTLIYSHGNSSDLIDTLKFFQYFLKKSEKDGLKMNALVYDYTGYGCSAFTQISEQTMTADLKSVLNWLKVPRSSIILWGFSLGSFPTVQVAAEQKVGGIILHSPLASGASFFQQNSELEKDSHLPYDVDCLSNVEAIGKISAPILILHSSADEIIPISHSLKLYQCLKVSKQNRNFSLIEMDQLQHNQIHSFLIDMSSNSVNVFVWNFLAKISQMSKKLQLIWTTDLSTEEDEKFKSINMGNNSNNSHMGYFQMS